MQHEVLEEDAPQEEFDDDFWKALTQDYVAFLKEKEENEETMK